MNKTDNNGIKDKRLAELRGQLADIDRRLLALWQQRMDSVAEIGRVKAAAGLPIYDAEQEAALWQIWRQKLPPEYAEQAAPLLCACTGGSRLYQQRLRGDKGHIYLIGMPLSGKSSLGAALAHRLEQPFIDLDSVIEAAAGQSVESIFAGSGESGFRHRETLALLNIALSDQAAVVACGGGIVLRDINISLMRASGRVVLIEREQQECLRHLDCGNRPLAPDAEAWQKLRQERQALYERAADHTVWNYDFIRCVSDMAALLT